MKKMIICTAAFAFAFTCAVAGISVAATGGAESLIIKGPGGKKEVNFPHHKHQGTYKCETCHHTKNADGSMGPYVAGKEAKCDTCHKLGKPSDNIHQKCKGCHKTEKAAGKNAPTSCGMSGSCHQKPTK